MASKRCGRNEIQKQNFVAKKKIIINKNMKLLLIHKRKDLRNTSCQFTNWNDMPQNRVQKNYYFAMFSLQANA